LGSRKDVEERFLLDRIDIECAGETIGEEDIRAILIFADAAVASSTGRNATMAGALAALDHLSFETAVVLDLV
jgi:hypothetical protein